MLRELRCIMKKFKIFNAFSLIANIAIIALTVIAVVSEAKCSIAQGESPIACFKLLSFDANAYLAITALLVAIADAASFITNKEVKPRWLSVLKFTATCAVIIEVVIATGFIGLKSGLSAVFGGTNLILRVINPIIAFASFCLFEAINRFDFREFAVGVSPAAAYFAVYCFMTVAVKSWNDFYGFNRNGLWLVSFIIVCVVSALVSIVVAYAFRAVSKAVNPDSVKVSIYGVRNK